MSKNKEDANKLGKVKSLLGLSEDADKSDMSEYQKQIIEEIEK